MASTTANKTLLQLGKIARTRGKLGVKHAGATQEKINCVAQNLGSQRSFSSKLENCIICVEDRLYANGQRMHAPRLAGGALSLGLMFHFLFGGDRLSDCLRELKRLGFYLVLHTDCGALKLAPKLIPTRLSDVNSEGYKVLEKLSLKTDEATRTRIAEWATSLPSGFFDIDVCMGIVDEVEQIVGEHNAVAAAVSLSEGESYVGGSELNLETDGLFAFGFDPWAADSASLRMGVAREDNAIAAQLAQVFTAEVLLELAADDLGICVHK